MQDVTFDDFGIGTTLKQNQESILDRNRFLLKEKFYEVIQGLDQYQKDIVFDKSSDLPLKITASAGSGKTQCIFAKALKMVLLDGIDPTSMVLITFTNKAANEIRDRYLNFFHEVLGAGALVDIPLPHISTIHSFGVSLLYKLFGVRRTIMTESHALKLLKSIILGVLEVKKIEAEVVKNVYKVIGEICANNELHFFCVPYFNGGKLQSVVSVNMLSLDDALIKTLDKFSRVGINLKLNSEGSSIDGELREKIIELYADKVRFSVNKLTEIVKLFIEKKGLSNTMDFSDMRLLPFYILNQDNHSLNSVWDQYEHLLIDEAQDMNTLDFGLVVTCDKDSYERFLDEKMV